MAVSKDTVLRTSRLNSVFHLLDSDGTGRLKSHSMRQFATLSGFSGSDADWHEEFRLLCEERNCSVSDGLDKASFVELINDPSEGSSFCSDRELHEICEQLSRSAARLDRAASGAPTAEPALKGPHVAKAVEENIVLPELPTKQGDRDRRTREATKRKIFWLLCPAGHGNGMTSSDLQHFAQLTGFEGDDTEWECEFNLLCEGAGVTDGTLSEGVFVALLDDATEKGLYCDDDELARILDRLSHPAGLPLPWHNTDIGGQLRSLRVDVTTAIFNVLGSQGRQLLDSDALKRFATLSGFEGGDVAWTEEFRLLCQERGCKESDGLALENFQQLVDDTSEHGCYCNDATLVKILAVLASQRCKETHAETHKLESDLVRLQVLYDVAERRHEIAEEKARLWEAKLEHSHAATLGIDEDAIFADGIKDAIFADGIKEDDASRHMQFRQTCEDLEPQTGVVCQAEKQSSMREGGASSPRRHAFCASRSFINRSFNKEVGEDELPMTTLACALEEAEHKATESRAKEELCRKELTEEYEDMECRAHKQCRENEAELIAMRLTVDTLEVAREEADMECKVLQSQGEQLRASLVEVQEVEQESMWKEHKQTNWEKEEMAAKQSLLEMRVEEMSTGLANQNAINEKQVELMRVNVQIVTAEHSYAQQTCQQLEARCASVEQRSQLLEARGDAESGRLAEAEHRNRSLEAEIRTLLHNFEARSSEKEVEFIRLEASMEERKQKALSSEAELCREEKQKHHSLELEVKQLQSSLEQASTSVHEERLQVDEHKIQASIIRTSEIDELHTRLREQRLVEKEMESKVRHEAEARSASLEAQLKDLQAQMGTLEAAAAADRKLTEVQARRASFMKHDAIKALREELEEQQQFAEAVQAHMREEAEARSEALEKDIQGLRGELSHVSAEADARREALVQESLTSTAQQEDSLFRMREELAEQQQLAFAVEAEIREEARETSVNLESQIENLHADVRQMSASMRKECEIFQEEEQSMSRWKEEEQSMSRWKELQMEKMQDELREYQQVPQVSVAPDLKSQQDDDQRSHVSEARLEEESNESDVSNHDRNPSGNEAHVGGKKSSQSSSRHSVRFSNIEQMQEIVVEEVSPELRSSIIDGDDQEEEVSKVTSEEAREAEEDQDDEHCSNYDDDIPSGEQDLRAGKLLSGNHELENTELAEVFRLQDIGYCRQAFVEKLLDSSEGAKVLILHMHRRNSEPMLSTLLRINNAGAIRREFECALLAQEYFGELAPRVVGSSPGLAKLPAGAIAVLQLDLRGSTLSLPGFKDTQENVSPLGQLFAVCRDKGLTGQHTVWPKFFSLLQSLFQKIAIPGGSLQQVTVEEVDLRDHLNLQSIVEALVPGVGPDQFGSKPFGTDRNIDALVLDHFRSQFLSEEDDLAQLELMVDELYHSGSSDGALDGRHGHVQSELLPVMFFLDLILSLSHSPTCTTSCRARMGYVHGDLHLNNVLYDEKKGVDNDRKLWIMDFEHVHRGHQFVDLARCLTVGIFVHSRLDDVEREQHLRSLVRIIASTQCFSEDFPEPAPETPGSVRFVWSFTATMLTFCRSEEDEDEEDSDDSQVKTSTQLIWALLCSSLQIFADCRKWQEPRRKRLVIYACIAFALRLRLEFNRDDHIGRRACAPRWLEEVLDSSQREARTPQHRRRTTVSEQPWFALQFLGKVQNLRKMQNAAAQCSLEQRATKCYLQQLCQENAWLPDPFTGVYYSVLSEHMDLNLSQGDQVASAGADGPVAENSRFLQELLDTRHRVLIVGAAGSGKTLQVRQLLTYISQSHLQASHGEVRRLPLHVSFLELLQLSSKMSEGVAAAPGKVLEAYMEMHISPQYCTMFQLSREQGWILMLDGADDAMGQEEMIHSWLERLLEQEPRHQVLITTRPDALQEASSCIEPKEGSALLSKSWLQHQGFVVLHMGNLGRGALWRICMRHHGALQVDMRKQLFLEVRRAEYRGTVTTPLMALMALQHARTDIFEAEQRATDDEREAEERSVAEDFSVGMSSFGLDQKSQGIKSGSDINVVFLYKFSFKHMLQKAVEQSIGGEADEKLLDGLSDAISQICSAKQEQHSRIILKSDFEEVCRDANNANIADRLMELWHLAMCGEFNLFERLGSSLRVFHSSMQDFLAATYAWTLIERGDVVLPGWMEDWGQAATGDPFSTRAMLFFADLAVKRHSIAPSQFTALSEGIGAVLRLVVTHGNRLATKNLASLPSSLDDRHTLLTSRSKAGGLTALHLACAAGHNDIVTFLLEFAPASRASLLMLRDDMQRIPLHMAAVRQTPVVLRSLLSYTKECPAMMEASDAEGKTALNRATGPAKMCIARSSLQAGTGPSARLRSAFLTSRQLTM